MYYKLILWDKFANKQINHLRTIDYTQAYTQFKKMSKLFGLELVSFCVAENERIKLSITTN